ncbi:hypothetical protein H2198_005513 [Neophaeococcomyces mojaviensis]|uniref:Uncharacterized protein n=1 Tax=Neophaeococcomyces mojaviensis TaxID=3383035 RepID=A0ACC3A683_9EURO|nr:hypothetical protein H2198_005513 [Knufia sp. JES_112]
MLETKHTTAVSSPVLRPIRRSPHLREVLCLLAAFAIIGQFIFAFQYCSIKLFPEATNDHAANSTLGFGGIYAVSRKGSPRRQSLLRAASLTNLNVNIPAQPAWTDKDLARIKAPVNSALDRGSAMAWLGHRNALEKFLKSSHDTALIMEDDVDWDTRLRTQQIPQTAYAIRELLNSRPGGYYGDLRSWDIIWLGHCGDFFNASRGSDITSIKSFHDPTMPNMDELHPWTKGFLQEIGANENQQRLVHQSVRPLCTFAYAITRSAAERVLNELTIREPTRHRDHPCGAYDVRLLEGCRDEGLRCISVNPELFHHSNIGSEIAQMTEDRRTDGGESEQEGAGDSPTTNIRCSARSRRWRELQDSITDPSIDAGILVRELAELSKDCYIDGL